MTHQLTAGLPDDAFASDGLLTKRVLRAAALASLAPVGGELLWDLGAGTGSISIEWCRLAQDNRAVAVERNPERAERIRENAARHGVAAQLTIVESDIAGALAGLPAPAAVFVGGGVEEVTLQACWAVLPSGGRLVVHSVTAESDAILVASWRTTGGELTRVAVETAEPIGRFTGFRPARTVTAWAAVKG
ncbi:MAG: precorrin-6Y C5,15-methyltransferase (decarboxylating) subunit CbiT [Propionicimonas sp.]|nr:precorrin-6Y C5,15-methyltransferase (decarboxylating) subunit CbiT [Propionicimonas sp.]